MKTRAAAGSSAADIWKTCRKAATSLVFTKPSALAILAPRLSTAMVKATERSGGVGRRSNSADNASPRATRAEIAAVMRVQIDTRPRLAAPVVRCSKGIWILVNADGPQALKPGERRGE